MNKIIIKFIFFFLSLGALSCYFKMEKDNPNDPDADNFTPPDIEASFIPSSKSGNVPLTVHFTDNSRGSIKYYEWDFDNDGTVDSIERDPSWTFSSAGNYNVRLKVRSIGLFEDEAVEQIRVYFGLPGRNAISEDNKGPYIICPADIDNDNDIDIVCGYVATYYGQYNKLSYWENTGNGSGWVEHVISQDDGTGSFYPISIHSADVDSDGNIDIIAAQYHTNEIEWWENGGEDNSWTKHVIKTDFQHASCVYADDIDGDGDIDIAGTAFGINSSGTWVSSEISWWENIEGTGSSWIEHSLKTDVYCASSVRVADMDNDGDKDIIAAIYGTINYSAGGYDHSGILWFGNESGGDWNEYIIMPEIGPDYLMCPRDLYACDMDNDGDKDIAAAYFYSDEIAIWLNSSAGTIWTRSSIDRDFFGAMSVYASDIDGDGDIDLIGASRLCDEIAWWENIGGGWEGIEEHAVDMEFAQATCAFASDINGDGHIDIAGAANGSGTTNLGSSLAWWSVYEEEGE